jgi:cytochrome c oxidase cbb3-type subunit 3
MKYLRIILLLPLAALAVPVFADDDHSLMSPQMENYVGYGVVLAALLIFIGVMLVLLRTFKILTKMIYKLESKKDAEIKAPLAPVEAASAKHQRNNPAPTRLKYLVFATVGFAACYLLICQVFGLAPLKYDGHKREAAQTEAAKKAFSDKTANRVDENTVKLTTDPTAITDGATIFKTSCAACHGALGQGVVGPNLTDDYWLHGGKINDVFKTIKYGVPAKAMPTWENLLSAKQIADVANYVKSLRGTNPPGAKEPQGIKE